MNNMETQLAITKALENLKECIDESVVRITDDFEYSRKRETSLKVSIAFELVDYNGSISIQKIKIKPDVKSKAPELYPDYVVDDAPDLFEKEK